ncbi:MAG: peroxiredoxin family protein [Candidatus Eisenbacteria bacterium]|uniref:Peroxiredoxin family protein n=1 Tax=Eiseniibacteriota bacterium TaxID=2212470 RepID=A0A9D6L6Q8_UNCEI|nr:peroxiredoxin family protein [Candidatus Eisenbacteria bacterium]
MKRIPMLLLAALAAPLASHAQTSEPKAPPTTTTARPTGDARVPDGELRIFNHVQVGEDAPDFELSDADGRPFRLSQMRGRRMMLNFADRRAMLPAFGALAESLSAMGVMLVGVCHDSPQSLKTMSEKTRVRFLLLSDPTGQVSSIYGAYDSQASSIVPGFVLVGPRGRVRMVFLGESLPTAELLELTRFALAGL